MIYHTRTLAIMVKPEGEPTFSELATTIQIEDESGGEFVVVSQHGTPEMGQIAINPEEWPTLRDAIDRMIAECRPINAEITGG